MEKRAARLAPVVDMASKAERDAATQLGRCQQQLLAAQQKLAELERYRNDYQQQWISQCWFGACRASRSRLTWRP